jgi:hypothetical protein
MVKHVSTPISTAMVTVSFDFFRWMLSIKRPKPGTLDDRFPRPLDEPMMLLRCPDRELFVSNACEGCGWVEIERM